MIFVNDEKNGRKKKNLNELLDPGSQRVDSIKGK
jgi:hypothetical protein